MDHLTLFGLGSVILMLVMYELEPRSHWFILGFAFSCILGALYCLFQGAWPLCIGELVWAAVAFKKWGVTKWLS